MPALAGMATAVSRSSWLGGNGSTAGGKNSISAEDAVAAQEHPEGEQVRVRAADQPGGRRTW
jgi:hypothetical protein